MLGLQELAAEFAEEKFVPNPLESLYSYFLENGVTLQDLDELPIPYIVNCYLTALYRSEKSSK